MKTITRLAIGLTAAAAAFACSKQPIPEAEDTSPPIVREAKAAFAAQFSATKSSAYTQFNPGTITPDWEHAILQHPERANIPIHAETKYQILRKEWKDGKPHYVYAQVHQELIARKETDGHIYFYMLTLIPDAHSSNCSPEELMNRYRLRNTEKNFSGIAIYSTLSGEQFQFIQHFKDGRSRSVWFGEELPKEILEKRAAIICRDIHWRAIPPHTKGPSGTPEGDSKCPYCWKEHEPDPNFICMDFGPEVTIWGKYPPPGKAEEEECPEWDDWTTPGDKPGDTPGGPGNDGGGGNGDGPITPPDPPLDSGVPWPKSIHDQILDSLFLRKNNLTRQQIDAMKRGSVLADKNQKITDNHIHAQRIPGETVEEALVKLMNYFIENVITYKQNNDYEALGMALHPIMDAYSRPHSRFRENNSIVEHLEELSPSWMNSVYATAIKDSVSAIDIIYSEIDQLSTGPTNEDISRIFRTWLKGYYIHYVMTR